MRHVFTVQVGKVPLKVPFAEFNALHVKVRSPPVSLEQGPQDVVIFEPQLAVMPLP